VDGWVKSEEKVNTIEREGRKVSWTHEHMIHSGQVSLRYTKEEIQCSSNPLFFYS